MRVAEFLHDANFAAGFFLAVVFMLMFFIAEQARFFAEELAVAQAQRGLVGGDTFAA